MISDCPFSSFSEPNSDDYFNAYLLKDYTLIPEIPLDLDLCIEAEREMDLIELIPNKL
jgi:hypothetical protein